MKKLKIEDLRIKTYEDGQVRITAAPFWAFNTEKPGVFLDYPPIHRVWTEVLIELNRRQAPWAEAKKQSWEEHAKRWDRDCSKDIAAIEIKAPEFCSFDRRKCDVCGEAFFSKDDRTKTCSLTCRRVVTRKLLAESRRRHATPSQPRKCEMCKAEFIPTRSDAKFCSGRCRVAHHRHAG